MKIKQLQTYCVAVPPPHIGGRYWIFVRLTTDDGIEGVGEVYAATFSPDVVAAAIKDVFERYLHDENPHQIERFYRRAYSSGFTQRPDLTMMGVVSGLEMACWDIIGKSLNKPIYDLLGGKIRDKIRTYTYLYPQNEKGEFCYDDLDLSVECSKQTVAKGFSAVKFDPAGVYSIYPGHQLSLNALARCEQFCQKIREAVGNRCDLLIGTHGQMVPSSAIRLAKRLEAYDPLWLEEPVPPGQAAVMAQVAQKTTIPIATGERLCTKYEFKDILVHQAASILQMNLARVGGILEAKKIAAMAEGFYAEVAPHLYNGPIGAMASVQLAANIPNFLIQESILDFNGFHNHLLHQPIPWQAGYINVPDAPGLGIDVDWQAVAENSPYTGKALHLMMSDEYPLA